VITAFTPRGGPGETRPKPLRRARVLKVPHYQLDDNVPLGLPRYAKAIPSDNSKSVRLEMQTNPLSLCLRPRALIKGLHH